MNLRKASGRKPFSGIWKHTILFNKGGCFSFCIFLQLRRPIGPKFSQLFCFMLGYTKWGYWSLTIIKVYPALKLCKQLVVNLKSLRNQQQLFSLIYLHVYHWKCSLVQLTTCSKCHDIESLVQHFKEFRTLHGWFMVQSGLILHGNIVGVQAPGHCLGWVLPKIFQ